MTIDISAALEAAAGIVTVVGGAYTTIKHLIHRSRQKRERYREDILKQAKEEISKVEAELEAKIKQVEVALETQKQAVSKDFLHFRETYNSEIKVLGQRIEELRQDLGTQHSSLVALLMKLIDKQ